MPVHFSGATDEFRVFLNRVLSDPSSVTSAPFVEPIEPVDVDLDGPQRDAVSRALQTPDLLLVQGLPGTGKSRVVAEIIRQAVRRGERILFLSRTAPAIDRVLAQIHDAENIVAVRCLGWEERAEQLSTEVSALRGNVREETLRSEWLRQACARERELLQRRASLHDLAPVWASLLELAELRDQRDRDGEVIRQRRDGLLIEVQRDADAVHSDSESDPFNVDLRQAEQVHQQRLAKIEMARVELQKSRIPLDTNIPQAKSHHESLKSQEALGRSWHVWSPSYWKAKFDKSLAERIVKAQAKLGELNEASGRLAEKENQLQREREQAAIDFAAEQSRLIDLEVRRRGEELDGREATLLRLDAENRERLSRLSSQLPADSSALPSATLEDLRSAREIAAGDLRDCEKELALARSGRESVERDPGPILERWRASVNLVAGPISSSDFDPWLGRAGIASAIFNLLIVDEAHLLTENELLAVAKRSRHWVFLGEPVESPQAPSHSRSSPSRNNASRPSRPAPDFFGRLWNRLHHDTWVREGDRLCCRLHPVDPAKRLELEIEWVADRPDVELRILNSESSEPILAEVLFPSSMNVAHAKEFLFREIGEIPCVSRIRTARWVSGVDCLIFHLNPMLAESLPATSIVLGEGITLHTSPEHSKDHGPCEVALVFSELGGWDRASAEAWVNKHLLKRDSGRTCRLETNYRQVPALAAWLNESVAVGHRYPTDHRSDGAVQFEPAPRRTPTGQRRGGAGLEINLADPAQREFLPLELAASLPPRGIVNLPEAQAIADLLPRLASGHSIAVTAPYPAQVAVLKHYCKGRIPVLSPAELEQRETDIVVVSLTRSHAARAVTFGDDPATMLRIFSRPRCRLVLIGDPGTITRRTQWEGEIDHFDEIAGERERRWVNALLRFLPSRPQHSRGLESAKA